MAEVSRGSGNLNEIERCRREQAECADEILRNKGKDIDGAWRGLGDWFGEEIFLSYGKFALAPAASTHGATCAKCGRVFTAPGEYRWAAGLKGNICRNARACAVRAEGNGGVREMPQESGTALSSSTARDCSNQKD